MRRHQGNQASTSVIDDAAALERVMTLMGIPGPSGEEEEILGWIKRTLRHAGLPARAMRHDAAHRRTPINGRCGNLIVRLPGTCRLPRRLLCAHVDTVPLCVGCRPTRRGNRVVSADPSTALGADNRSGVGAILTALLEILCHRLPHPPLTFVFVVQEEVGLQGMRCIAKRQLGDPRLAFNFDGGVIAAMTVAATGAYRARIEVEGRASHAGVHPEDGVSAITIAGHAIATLHRDGWLGSIEKGVHHGTSNVGVIEGGTATNVVAPHAVLDVEVRSHDPRFRKRVLKAFRAAFDDAAAAVQDTAGRGGRVRFMPRLDYESFSLGRRDPSLLAARDAIASLGLEPQPSVTNGGVDANWLAVHGYPAVTLGAGQHHAHTVREYLDIAEYRQGCRVALNLATGGHA